MKHSNSLLFKAITAFVLLALLITTAGCGSNVNSCMSRSTDVVISDAHMVSFVDENGVPAETVDTVATIGTWYVSAFLSNTQPDTIIYFNWYNFSGNLVNKTRFDTKGALDIYIYGSFAIPGAALEGQYRVDIFVGDAANPAATVDFTADEALNILITTPSP